YDCALACEYEGIPPTLKRIRSMCYLLKKLNELPDWIFMSEQPIRSQGKVSKNFRLCEQDEQTDILFDVKPPSYHVEPLDECSRSDLLGACLMALPVRCPKQGDQCLGLAGALREELVKKPRLCEIQDVIDMLLKSKQASVHGCGRWRWELAKLEAASEEKLVALGSRVDVSDRQRSFPAGAQPATQKKRKRGGKAKNPRARAKQTVPHLGLPYQ
ncbi:Ift52, partial [Symbiodinium necroappetens]